MLLTNVSRKCMEHPHTASTASHSSFDDRSLHLVGRSAGRSPVGLVGLVGNAIPASLTEPAASGQQQQRRRNRHRGTVAGQWGRPRRVTAATCNPNRWVVCTMTTEGRCRERKNSNLKRDEWVHLQSSAPHPSLLKHRLPLQTRRSRPSHHRSPPFRRPCSPVLQQRRHVVVSLLY